jgi:hypothetical protein
VERFNEESIADLTPRRKIRDAKNSAIGPTIPSLAPQRVLPSDDRPSPVIHSPSVPLGQITEEIHRLELFGQERNHQKLALMSSTSSFLRAETNFRMRDADRISFCDQKQYLKSVLLIVNSASMGSSCNESSSSIHV